MEHHKKVNEIKLEGQMALIVLILAIFAPGWSTIIAGVLSKNDDQQKSAIIVGILQVLLTFILVGWIWAIISALAIKKNSA